MFQLFDDKPRDYTGPSRRAETSYSFLDRSSLPEFERVRNMLERWVQRLPEEQRKEAISKMRHKGQGSLENENQFNETFFEVFLHEFLNGTGGTGGEVIAEPRVEGLTPDFGVTEKLADGNELSYVVEATSIDLERGTALSHNQNELTVLDWINEITSPDFGLHIEMTGDLKSLPRKENLKRHIEEFLEEADYEEVFKTSQELPRNGLESYPGTSFEHGSWKLTANLVPVAPEVRGTNSSVVSIVGMGPAIVNDIDKVKVRLYDKAKRYKNVENLIIAVRMNGSSPRMEEVLFGTRQVRIYSHNDPMDTSPLPDPHHGQRLDGFWFNSGGPNNENVIGVVVFSNLYPGTVDMAKAVFYANPYLDRPMPAWTKAIGHAEYPEDNICIINGVPPCEFLSDYEAIGYPFEKHLTRAELDSDLDE